ncbi:hypothetical protein [Tardiphaga sp.]|uniref:hypothetical protein n=1 Tax=Tardiphaga sp. TaxID=1926292 RepID=UPI0019BB6205|nr:hypothetical protein [Tardiphaga sp.]MBC7576420.1 hypothetical protein [Tardiphaga sp.]
MTHASKPIICAAAIVLLLSCNAFAQSGDAVDDVTGRLVSTTSPGTANSGVGIGIAGGVTAGGTLFYDKPTTGDAAVDAQDREVDRKLNSICKGC